MYLPGLSAGFYEYHTLSELQPDAAPVALAAGGGLYHNRGNGRSAAGDPGLAGLSGCGSADWAA